MQPAERVGWMLQKRAENPALADEVLSLLEHADANDQFLETPGFRSEAALGNQPGEVDEQPLQREALEPGTCIGSWRVIRAISRGGEGAVYLAGRWFDEDRASIQQAAIKVMTQTVDPAIFSPTFRRERRVPARPSQP